ncbi:MAG TPA: multidrug efflux SMR transporter [Acidimicrobiales bacterium]
MAWAILLVAGVAEVVFATSLGASDGFSRLWPSMATFAFGTLAVLLLSRAVRDIPLSTAYAAFTAMGTVGATAVAIALHGERATAARLAAIGLVVVGVVALRLTGDAA